ncbi:hypothetical protein [Pigmentiphaga aceris]|uniref:hypothetical protein n=1 Tax=Pigmentiphaga aceris TaxID=1940612 RepID=UPI0016520C2D|nr:hypothetical protein [Pigmentiphaga aceris]
MRAIVVASAPAAKAEKGMLVAETADAATAIAVMSLLNLILLNLVLLNFMVLALDDCDPVMAAFAMQNAASARMS